MPTPLLTEQGLINLKESMLLRNETRAMHEAQYQAPEFDAAILLKELDKIDEAFGNNDPLKIANLLSNDEMFSFNASQYTVTLHEISGAPAASKAQAMDNWGIAARNTIQQGRAR